MSPSKQYMESYRSCSAPLQFMMAQVYCYTAMRADTAFAAEPCLIIAAGAVIHPIASP